MNSKIPGQFQMSRRRALAAPAAAMLAGVLGPALLSACGGGGDGGTPAAGAGGAQSFMSGPITGLGSIIVGGVRFDDNSAQVESEDDDGGAHSRSELQLGMMVEVESSSIDDNTSRGTAVRIRFGSELKGPVALIDPTAQTFTVLDQTVEVHPETVFDPLLVGGFAAIKADQILEIHAQFDATTGHYSATRIELEDNATEYRLRGFVSLLDTVAKTFNIGDAVINYGGVTDLPADFANGLRVRVRLKTAQVGGQWVATRVRAGVRRVDGFGDARIRGLVTAFTTATQFEVQGVPVEVAAGARVEGTVADGVMVEVRGRADSGRIIASRVKVLNRSGDEVRGVELHGTVSGLEPAAKTFMLREVKVSYANVIAWKDGDASTLDNGKAVEVKGLWSDDRSVLNATSIDFE